MELDVSRQIFEKSSSINFMKICLVGDELFQAGGGGRGGAVRHGEANSRFTVSRMR
jgi:hypothetical protein